jgi:hypothetical protein
MYSGIDCGVAAFTGQNTPQKSEINKRYMLIRAIFTGSDVIKLPQSV